MGQDKGKCHPGGIEQADNRLAEERFEYHSDQGRGEE